MAHDPRGPQPGDRSRRTDDRYLFLEALLSARDRLLVTYTGQSIRDNAAIPPSVLVAELCDYLVHGASTERERKRRLSEVTVRHPLQAFSARYFNGESPRLFSYESSYVPSRASRAPVGVSRAFFPEPLPAEPKDDVIVSDLVRFFQNPTAFVFRERLGVSLRDVDVDVPDREPLELSPLERYSVGQFYLDARFSGASEAQAEGLVLATRLLPQANLGQRELAWSTAIAGPIARQAEALLQGEEPRMVAVVATLGDGRRLVGHLAGVSTRGRLECQFARIRARHLIGLWIRHLVHSFGASGADAPTSSLIGRAARGSGVQHFQLPRVPDARERLDDLSELYQMGRRRPLPLFPEASLAFARSMLDKPDRPEAAWEAARRAWTGELESDLHLQRAYGARSGLPTGQAGDAGAKDADPARANEFARLSLRFLSPLLERLIEVTP